MHGMCSKCAQMAKPACGCGGAPDMMPMPLPMPMSAAPVEVDEKKKGQMKEAAKRLISKIQDIDFNKVESFDLKIVMSGDADEMAEEEMGDMEDRPVDSDSSNTYMEEADEDQD
jgi:hypothetical protein